MQLSIFVGCLLLLLLSMLLRRIEAVKMAIAWRSLHQSLHRCGSIKIFVGGSRRGTAKERWLVMGHGEMIHRQTMSRYTVPASAAKMAATFSVMVQQSTVYICVYIYSITDHCAML
jgi:hypothetical protein